MTEYDIAICNNAIRVLTSNQNEDSCESTDGLAISIFLRGKEYRIELAL
jgi:hypothetical protein